MQALEETVASRERRVTEAARTLRATARAVLRKIEPFTQVGSYPLRQGPGGGGCPEGVLESGGAGGEGQRPEIVLPIPPVSPACSAPCPACLFSLQLRQEARDALTQATSSVQVATVTVTGAKTLLADLEGTRALPSLRLLDAQMPVTTTRTPASARPVWPWGQEGDRSPVVGA